MITYETATPEHVAFIAANLRAADRRELHRHAGLPPDLALSLELRLSSVAVTALVDGVPAAIFGVVTRSMLTRDGAVWMMTTPLVEKHPRAMLQAARQWLRLIGDGYERLFGFVDAEYLVAVRWLQRIGFVMDEAAPMGPVGALFHRFSLEVPKWVSK